LRSRAVRAGGLTTKVHTRANAEGLAVGFHLTPGQASDMTAYDDLMAEDVALPEAMLGDKGYDTPRSLIRRKASIFNSRPNRRLPIGHLRLHKTPNLGVHEIGSRPQLHVE
jgi:hypothetical protein